MTFFTPIVTNGAINRNHFIKKLLKKNAVSKESAVSLSEAGIANSNDFELIMVQMMNKGILHQNGDRYYLDITKL